MDRDTSSARSPTDGATVTHRPQVSEATGHAYLLVMEGDSAFTYDLPMHGKIEIGRGQDVQLRLEEAAASRRHASLTMGARDVQVADLGSHNGTRVNGELITGPRTLLSGDVIGICGATLVFQREPGGPVGRRILDVGALRQRLEEEVERSLLFERPLSMLCLRLARPPGRRALGVALAQVLRKMDVPAWDEPCYLFVLLPETRADELAQRADELLRALEPLGAEGRVGSASCPEDGRDPDALLGGARSAAATTGPKRVASVADTATTRRIGKQSFIIADPAMQRLYEQVERLARSDLPVLIHGETGAGKEIVASAVHHWSPRAEKPLISVNCAAIPENLVESELFGYEAGAFTNANRPKAGLLEAAHGGSLFLDELGELPLAVQAKLLRALETRRITRLGDVRERAVDIRVIAATNRNLEAEVEAGRFREDLLFRLKIARIVIPPLRDRQREIAMLARELLRDACGRIGRAPMEISRGALHQLLAYRWPGNVRELRNVMDYVAATVQEPELQPWHLSELLTTPPPKAAVPSNPAVVSLGAPLRFRPLEEEISELERTRLSQAMAAAGGVKTRAAELIGMPIRTFSGKLKVYRIGASEPESEGAGP